MDSTPEIRYTYDAFMSYSHAADAQFAPFLQAAVQGFAKPWYKLRSVRIFRDQTGLTLTPELWPDIERAINSSRFFILLAGPEAAASKWVRDEVAHWLTLQRTAPLLVITGGEVKWDPQRRDFDWSRTTALPDTLAGVYRHEPLYLDAVAIKAEELSQRHAKIRSAAAQIYSRLTGRSLDEVIGEDVRQYRRTRSSAAVAVTVVAGLGAMYAFQRVETQRQEAIATARRQLDTAKSLALESLSRNAGPDAVNVSDSDVGRAAMLAVESVNLVPTVEGNDALNSHLALIPRMADERKLPPLVTAVVVSRDGELLATVSADGAVSVQSAFAGQSRSEMRSSAMPDALVLANDGRLFGFRSRQLSELKTERWWDIDAQDVSAFRLSPDGRYFATAHRASAQSDTAITLWRTSGREQAGRWTAGRPLSAPLAFSNNSAFLAFVDRGQVAVVDIASGAVRRSPDTELVEITALAVDNSGDAVLVLGWETDPRYIVKKNFVVRSFPTTGTSTFRPIYHRGESHLNIARLAIDMQARVVGFGGGPLGWVKVMDYISTAPLAVVRDDQMTDWTLTSRSHTPEIITAGTTWVRRYKIQREPAEAAAPALIIEADMGPEAALNKNGTSIAVAGIRKESGSPFVAVVDLRFRKKIFERNLLRAADKVLLSPDGAYVAVSSGDGRAEVTSIASGQVVWSAPAFASAEDRAADLFLDFSPDSTHIVWGRSAQNIFIEDLVARHRRTVSGPVQGLIAVAASPGGRTIAWSFDSSDQVRDQSCPCVALAFPNARPAKPEILSIPALPSGRTAARTALAFDSSGRQLAIGVSGSLRVMDVYARRSTTSFFHEGEIHSIAFTDDGQHLLTTGTGRLLNNPERFEAAVWSLAEARRVWRRLTPELIEGFAMTSVTGPVVLARSVNVPRTGYLGIAAEQLYWRPRDLVRIACERVTYRLTPEEREALLPGASGIACPAPR